MRLRPMTMADADFMLELKNDPDTRRFAIVTKRRISKKAHYKWIARRLRGFKVITGNLGVGPLGVIRIFRKEVSIWIHKEYRGWGLATTALRIATRKGRFFFAKIVDGNTASMRAFVKAGFIPIDHKDNYYILRK